MPAGCPPSLSLFFLFSSNRSAFFIQPRAWCFVVVGPSLFVCWFVCLFVPRLCVSVCFPAYGPLMWWSSLSLLCVITRPYKPIHRLNIYRSTATKSIRLAEFFLFASFVFAVQEAFGVIYFRHILKTDKMRFDYMFGISDVSVYFFVCREFTKYCWNIIYHQLSYSITRLESKIVWKLKSNFVAVFAFIQQFWSSTPAHPYWMVPQHRYVLSCSRQQLNTIQFYGFFCVVHRWCHQHWQ